MKILSVALAGLFTLSSMSEAQRPPLTQRPPPSERKFNSTAVEELIAEIVPKMKDPLLATIFQNAFPNTLDTTVELFEVVNGRPDTFIITGDIPAMWFRDSTNQVAPYLPLISKDEKLKQLVQGLINRHADSVLHDSYANAFNQNEEGGPWQGDIRTPRMTKRVFEGKYELDSLAAILKLSSRYFKYSGDITPFDATWLLSVEKILKTIIDQQQGTNDELSSPSYKFNRLTEVATDTLMMQGRGPPAKKCGLSKCAFRPSDDATTLPFLIPANAMAVVELIKISELLETIASNSSDPEKCLELASTARKVAAEIQRGIEAHAIVNHPNFGKILAYEVDGYGSSYFMDDANIPGLLSLPYLEYMSNQDPLYVNTRSFVLSEYNQFYFSGKAGKGIGGPHVGYGYIWPMGLCVQGLTSNDDQEISELLETLKTTTAGTNFMHESFWRDDPNSFTRDWFAWANSLFAEFVIKVSNERPYLIFK